MSDAEAAWKAYLNEIRPTRRPGEPGPRQAFLAGYEAGSKAERAEAITACDAVIEQAETAEARARSHSSGISDETLVQDLELSVRSIAILKRGGLLTVGDVRSHNDEWLKGLGFSKRFLNEVREVVGYFEARL